MLVPVDSRDPLVQPDHRVSEVQRVTRAGLVPLVNLGQSGHVVLLGHRDNVAKQVRLASRDLKELQVQRASQEHQVYVDRRDSVVQLEPPATQVCSFSLLSSVLLN